MKYPSPYYVTTDVKLEDWLIGLFAFGTPLDVSVVGVFDDSQRGSRRDMDLPPHRDGVYSKDLADAQGGFFIERKDINVVGLYCLRSGSEPCYTTIGNEEINLQAGEGLILDNDAVEHGRKGPVGDRILLRVWIKKHVL